jgi:hypothetical protein
MCFKPQIDAGTKKPANMGTNMGLNCYEWMDEGGQSSEHDLGLRTEITILVSLRIGIQWPIFFFCPSTSCGALVTVGSV